MSKNSDKVKRWRIRQKIKLLEYKGNKCEKCGYDKIQYLSAFDFHHKNPDEKEFGIGEKGRCISIEKIEKEVDKCLLLCGRCHQEIHDEEHWEERKRLLSVTRKKVTKEIICPVCNKRFKQKRKEQKCCSPECGWQSARIVPDIDIEKLKKDYKEIGYKKVLEKYNLKKTTFYKLIKK